MKSAISGQHRLGSEPPPPFGPADIVADKYRVERIVGRGGMGFIVEATHLHLDERVALKFLRANMLKNPEVQARFSREARAAAKLKSEHVARVHDVGVFQGMPYMVMEYLEGEDLGTYLTTHGRPALADAVDYVIQACEALAEAHARGIVHRDIKPDNLFLTRLAGGTRRIKVLDFGISKAALTGKLSEFFVDRHETTALMGSPYYMSPEQLRSTKDVDHRADIWSLGAVLYELLAGVTAFEPKSELTEIVAAILETKHRPLSQYARDVPPGLEEIVERCLAKDKLERFQTTAELAVSLLPYAHGRSQATADRALRLTKASALGPLVEHIEAPASVAPPLGSDPPLPDLRVSALPRDLLAREEVVTLVKPTSTGPAAPIVSSPLPPPVSGPAPALAPVPSQPAPVEAQTVAMAIAPTVPAGPGPSRRWTVAVLVLLAASLGGAVIWLLLSRGRAPEANATTSASLPAATAPKPTAEPLREPSAAPSAEPPAPSPNGSTEVPHTEPKAAEPLRPKPAPKPSPSPTATPTPKPLEIRMTR
ncbi:MAG: protein kinase [Myxococcales bacterium]|nr:protein kinase [Myxococcales bacterium]